MNAGEEAWKSGKEQRYTGVWRNGQGKQTVLVRWEIPGEVCEVKADEATLCCTQASGTTQIKQNAGF